MTLLRENLNKMLYDLKQYNHKDKSELFLQYVSDRLNKSLSNYEKDLTSKYNSILSYDEVDIIKNLSKEKKNGN